MSLAHLDTMLLWFGLAGHSVSILAAGAGADT